MKPKLKSISIDIETYTWIMKNRGDKSAGHLITEIVEEKKKQVSVKPIEQPITEKKKMPSLEELLKPKSVLEDIKTKRITELQNKNRNPFEDAELKKLLT